MKPTYIPNEYATAIKRLPVNKMKTSRTKYRYNSVNGLIYVQRPGEAVVFIFPHNGECTVACQDEINARDMSPIAKSTVKYFVKEGGYIKHFRTYVPEQS